MQAERGTSGDLSVSVLGYFRNKLHQNRRGAPSPSNPQRPFHQLPSILLFAIGACVFSSHAHAQGGYSEYELKAAYLLNFSKFIEWPNEDEAGESKPFCVGILGKDPFKRDMEKIVAGKTAKKRPIEIRRGNSVNNLAGCEIVFITTTDRRELERVIQALEKEHALTVGESEQFMRAGGIIRFTLEKGKIRFEINTDAAQRAQLKISSKLLSLAKVVKDR